MADGAQPFKNRHHALGGGVIERLDHFMARANATYYATHDPYSDFTTAPEISQVFGELLGLWAAVTWQAMGRPNPIIFAEAGPGRGTLMSDALRAIRAAMPDFAEAAHLHFVETSPRLCERQQALHPQAIWHPRIDDLPKGPLLLLANEFLDALPIRQFIRHEHTWLERWVENGAFRDQPTTEALPAAAPGTVIERCEPACALAATVARRFLSHPGAALFLDYGPEHSAPGDSLQALQAGRPTDPLADPGAADLTAHVDFEAFANAARAAGATVYGPVAQGVFLAKLGLFQRTDRLAHGRPPHEAFALKASARRLAEPDQMGRLFKAIVLCHSTAHSLAHVPAGFEP